MNEYTLNELVQKLKKEGPKDAKVLEMLSLFKYENSPEFGKYENDVLKYMGLFYKNVTFSNTYDIAFSLFDDGVFELYHKHFTPIQAEIKSVMLEKKYLLFSAPTSSGKSFLMKDLIMDAKNDIVIIVPTRALLNEYVRDIKRELYDNKIRNYNVLPFVELINKKHVTHNIFVLTPERAFELNNYDLQIDLFIFDEAQIIDSNENIRALKYRLLLKKLNLKYKDSKKLFAYPFVQNLDEVNNYIFPNSKDSNTLYYPYQNVGQIFIEQNQNGRFKVFDKDGDFIKELKEDPVINVLHHSNSSVLIYCSKSKIYNGTIYNLINKYLSYCEKVTNSEAIEIINKVKERIGAYTGITSKLVELMYDGIVVHHGALPHTIRFLIESFINKGYAKICIATTTLEQGVNMPFDIVYLYEMTNLKNGLDLKNLIGRAGRTTLDSKLDYGLIITRNKKNFVRKLNESIKIDLTNQIDVNEDFEVLKEAIVNDEIDDVLNMPKSIIERMTCDDVIDNVKIILALFENINDVAVEDHKIIRDAFEQIYRYQLKGNRELTSYEKAIFTTAIKIMIWRFQKKKFSEIVYNRYMYYTRDDNGIVKKPSTIKFFMIPNSKQVFRNLFDKATSDYFFDLIVYDTYEYIDKCLNLYLNDVFITAIKIYMDSFKEDKLAIRLYNFLKYGSDINEEIMLFKYGFTDDEIEILIPYIVKIDEEEVIFDDKIEQLEEELKQKCLYYKY